jgi:phosphatidyl-myo-inositol dimannoside synthase
LRMWASLAVLRRCDCIQANSRFTRQFLLKLGVREDRIVVTTPGIDVQKLVCNKSMAPSLASRLAEKRIVLTVGRFVPRKGQEMVLRALPRIVEAFPDLVYVMAGGGGDAGYRAQCDAVIREQRLENHALILEDLDNESVAWLYDACEVFIMANHAMPDGDTEGYGIVFLEAGAFGKPVIGGRDGGVPDAVDEGITGLLVNGLDTDDIARAITAILSDADTARRMGEAGRHKALRNAWGEKSREYRNLLGRLAAGARRPGMLTR